MATKIKITEKDVIAITNNENSSVKEFLADLAESEEGAAKLLETFMRRQKPNLTTSK